jgi:putative RNA 2'-phosphotransferase
MKDAQLVRISKYLSKHLRHQPERLGLELAPGGWVAIDALLAACAQHGFPISRAELAEVVADNDKQRFAFDPSGTLIRAQQGHSVEIDLQLERAAPPPVLYHGTVERNLPAIFEHGLLKMQRHHVHLSADVATATKVGGRRGQAVVLVVDAGAMEQAGFSFFRSGNGVWLAEHVPPQYLRQLS